MIKTILKIDGMKCGMCEAHINELIIKNFKVNKVASSHIKNETIIISEDDISEEILHQVIDPTGYIVLSIEKEPYQKKHFFKKIFKNKEN